MYEGYRSYLQTSVLVSTTRHLATLQRTMEASCSGRCLDADPLSFAGRTLLQRGTAAPSNCQPARPHVADQLPASLPAVSRSRTFRFQRISSSKHAHRQTRCAAAPAVEVLTLGTVADVEEIEGLRVVLNEYKRPMVEYLVKWKVCLQSTALSDPCPIICKLSPAVLLTMSDSHGAHVCRMTAHRPGKNLSPVSPTFAQMHVMCLGSALLCRI